MKYYKQKLIKYNKKKIDEPKNEKIVLFFHF